MTSIIFGYEDLGGAKSPRNITRWLCLRFSTEILVFKTCCEVNHYKLGLWTLSRDLEWVYIYLLRSTLLENSWKIEPGSVIFKRNEDFDRSLRFRQDQTLLGLFWSSLSSYHGQPSILWDPLWSHQATANQLRLDPMLATDFFCKTFCYTSSKIEPLGCPELHEVRIFCQRTNLHQELGPM